LEVINADKDGDFLFIVESGLAVKKPVLCGISSNDYVEILEGIIPGDEVVLYAYSGLEEGMAVVVAQEDVTADGPSSFMRFMR
jgi:hypothetical protein